MLEFIDYAWQSYDKLRKDPDSKNRQTRLLVGTGLCEPNNGIEHAFLPTKTMQECEERIKELYSKLSVESCKEALCNEVFYTTKLEGANTTIKRTQEIYDGKELDPNNYFSEKMVLGSFNATKLLSVYGNKMNKDILVKMWNVLIDGCCENEDIRGDMYRVGNVSVGNHIGLNYEYVEEAMDNWLDFYNSDSFNECPFIKAAILHFSFEFIHPFCDGNGRAGRLLMSNYLIASGFEKLKAVSISRSIEKNRIAYDYAFSLAENAFLDCTYFIEYMLGIFEDALYDSMESNGLVSELIAFPGVH